MKRPKRANLMDTRRYRTQGRSYSFRQKKHVSTVSKTFQIHHTKQAEAISDQTNRATPNDVEKETRRKVVEFDGNKRRRGSRRGGRRHTIKILQSVAPLAPVSFEYRRLHGGCRLQVWGKRRAGSKVAGGKRPLREKSQPGQANLCEIVCQICLLKVQYKIGRTHWRNGETFTFSLTIYQVLQFDPSPFFFP